MGEPDAALRDELKSRLDDVFRRIREACERAGRDPEDVQLVAVSKTHPVEMIRAAADAGCRVFGENYAQELRDKSRELGDAASIEWHFVGSIQRNKVKYLVGTAALLHAVDSEKVLMEVEKRAARQELDQQVLVEVNLASEVSKAGIDEEGLNALLMKFGSTPHVRCVGLMTMPPFWDDPERVRPYFRRLRALRDELGGKGYPNVELIHLSMGMTGDFEAAVEEGATIVRVGTAIFGPRG